MTRRWTVMATGLCLLAAASAGCVSKAEYDRVVAAARNANQARDEYQGQLQTARADNQKLRGEIALRDEAMAAKDKKIGLLEDANVTQKTALNELYDKYQELLKRQPLLMGRPVLPVPVDTALKALAKENADLMEYLPSYGMLKLKSDLTFDKGSADVKAEVGAALTKLAGIINSPAAAKFHVYVAGHTDDMPLRLPETIRKHGTNWGLSVHRALAVVKQLFLAGVKQKRMGAAGFSKYHPVAPNKPGRKGNPANRRVEIWILPPQRFLTISGN